MRRHTPARLRALLTELVPLEPGSTHADRVRLEMERAMTALLRRGGLASLDSALAPVRQPSLTRTHSGVLTQWQATLDGQRRLEIAAFTGDFVLTSCVFLEPAQPKKPVDPRHATQQEFYQRYMAVGQRVYRAKARVHVTPGDRLILLVGELEADVNNGGFDQYLLNKGRRRARAALGALRAIGARKTARMLESALAPGVSPETLEALDTRFYDVPEDLALFTMRHLARARSRKQRSA